MENNYTNSEIREHADSHLKLNLINSLKDHGYKIRNFDLNTQDDGGEDFLIQVEPRQSIGDSFVFPFFIQNKGISDINKRIIKDRSHEEYGKIAFSIKIRNAKRYCEELPNPIVITVCDIQNNRVYWHPIQLDIPFKQRILDQQNNNIETITFYINMENVIEPESIQRFLNDLQKSKRLLDKKYQTKRFLLPPIINNSFAINKERHVVEILYDLIKKFEGLPILPKKILQKLYPFSLTQTSDSYHKKFTLFTDNKILYDFLDNLYFENKTIKFKEEDRALFQVTDYYAKTEEILNFFHRNLIYNVAIVNKYNSEINLSDFYQHRNCACERCSYNKLDFKKSIDSLKEIDTTSKDKYALLRNAYILCKFGDYKTACNLYLRLFRSFYDNKEFISAFICQYNLNLLAKLIHSTYIGSDRYQLLNLLSTIDLDAFIEQIRDSDTDLVDILEWIKNDKFISASGNKISYYTTKIHDRFLSDQYGSMSSNEYVLRLFDHAADLDVFTKGNLLIYDIFFEFQQHIEMAVKGLIASYAITNNNTSKIHSINNYMVDLMLFHCETDFLKKTFREYNAKNLKYTYDPKIDTPFIEKVENLFSSFDRIEELVSDGSESYKLKDNISKIVNNIVYLSTKLDLTPKDYNYISSQILNIYKQSQILRSNSVENVEIFLGKRAEHLSLQNIEEWFEWSVDHEHNINKKWVFNLFPELFWKKNKKYRITSEGIYLKIFENIQAELSDDINSELHWLGMSITIQDIFCEESKVKLKNIVSQRLNSNFNYELYYLASIFEIIDYKIHFDKFIECVPSNKAIRDNPRFWGDDNINKKLEDLLNLSFKYNIDLSPYQNLHDNVPFYKWVMNLQKYDYSEFQARWILLLDTKFFYQQYRKSNKLKRALEEFIIDNPVKGIVRAYMHIYNPIF